MATQAAVLTLHEPAQINALSQPLRARVLDALREPDSAAGVARTVEIPRQKVNYHLKELERVGLVTHQGERRKGNFVEQLFQSTARRYVIAPGFAWDEKHLAATLADQTSLAQLVSLGEGLQRDATALLDAAAFDSAEIPSFSVQVQINFDSDASRQAFMKDYMASLQSLAAQYGSRQGTPFRMMAAAYPDPEIADDR